jgi:hypothetical protein
MQERIKGGNPNSPAYLRIMDGRLLRPKATFRKQ